MNMDALFKDWLIKNKKLAPRSAGNVLSHLNRVSSIIKMDCSESPNKIIFELSEKKNFKTLSVSVRSHLKRAIKLYLNFINDKSSGHQRK